MEKLDHLDKYYLPYLSKDPLLLMLYKWKKGLPSFDNMSPDKEPSFQFPLYSDLKFLLQWFYLFPDTERDEKTGWLIPKQRPCKKVEERLRDLQKNHPEARYDLLRMPQECIIYSEAIYLFVVDQLAPQINHIVNSFYLYYEGRMPKKEEIGKKVKPALLCALLDTHPFQRLGLFVKASVTESSLDPTYYWGSFWRMDVCQRFKENLYRAIGEPTVSLENSDDKKFIAEFEKEWQRAQRFCDLRGNFDIIPLFTDDDMVRYANICRYNRNIKYTRIQIIVWQMIDYVVLQICPKLWQTLDHIEPERFQGWQRILLGLTQPLVDAVVRKQERIMNEGRQEKAKRRLTQEEERKIRESVQSRILKLATEEYNYLYGKKQVPGEIRTLMREIELNKKKIMDILEKKESSDQETWASFLQKDEDLNRKLFKRLATWAEEGGPWIYDHSLYLPSGPVGELYSDEELKEIKKRGTYPRKALLRRIENLKQKYTEAEKGKNWTKARELVKELGKAERERETGQSVLRVREKSRWVWPSRFIYQKIRADHLLEEHAESPPQKVSHLPDGESSWEDALDDELGQKALTAGAISPDEFAEYASLEKLNQKRLLDKNVVIEDDSGHKREYVRLGKLADMVGCSPKTLIRMEERGEIKFEWRRVKGGEIQTEGKGVGKRGRWMRLFPLEKIDEIRCCFLKDRNIAEMAGVRANYLSRLKKKLGLDELPRLQQKKKSIELAKQRRKNRK